MSYTPNEGVDLGFQFTSNIVSGGTFNSGVIDARDFQQVDTHVISDQNGTLGFKFCSTSNCSGTTVGQNGVERYLSVPYVASTGFQLYSAPAFTPYVQYSFTNTGTADTTQFFYETKLLKQALSGQLLRMDGFISPSMVSNLGRSVQVGQEPDGTFTNTRIDGVAFRENGSLGANSGYTSPVTSTEGYSQIETHLYSEQAGTLVGSWYDDENKTTLLRTFTRPYQGDEVGQVSYFSAPVFGPYVQYVYTNGPVSASTFFLDFHPRTKAISGQILGVNDFIPDSVVANLGRNVIVGQDQAGNFRNVGTDSEGHLKIHLDEPLTAFGELRNAEITPIIQVTHPYEINYDLLSSGGTGSGYLSYDSGNTLTEINSGAATSSSSYMRSNSLAKYRNGQGMLVRFTSVFDTPVTGNTQWVGWGDSEGGFFFGYSGTTFGIMRRYNSVDNFTPQTEWNIDRFDGQSNSNNPGGQLLNPQFGNVYQIQIQWLGYGAIRFDVESNQSGQFEPAHMIKYANENLYPSVTNPTFPIYFESKNTTNDTNVVIKNASFAAFVEGRVVYTGRNYSFRNSVSVGTDTHMFTLRVPSTYKGKTNRGRVLLKSISAIADGNQEVSYQIIKNATITTPSYTQASTYSITETDTAGGYTASTGRVLYTIELNKISNVTTNIQDLGIFVNAGETISIIGDSSGANAGAGIAVSWVEDL